MTEQTGPIRIPTSSKPADADLRTAYRIVRAPTTGTLEALVLSKEIYGCETHYFRGRTRPHTEPACEACDEGIGKRWQGYLAILLTRTRDLCLFEFTAAAAAPLVEYFEHNHALDGAVITAYRTSTKPNARVVIRVQRGDVELYHAPPAPDIATLLHRIWSIDRLTQHETQRLQAATQAQTANPQPADRARPK